MDFSQQASEDLSPSRRIHVPVLMYHSISRVAQDYNAVSAEAFAEQMQWVAHERQPITLAQAQEALKGGPVPDKAVLVTFDDGYQELLEYAVPILLKYTIPAVFFLLIEALGGDDRWNPRAFVTRQHFTPDEVRQLAALPGMTIGAHGFTHQRVTRFEEYRIAAEMAGAKAGLEVIGNQAVTAYAYPFGGFSDLATKVASRYFQMAFASDGAGVWNWLDNPYAIRRLYVAHQISLAGFKQLLEKGTLPDRKRQNIALRHE